MKKAFVTTVLNEEKTIGVLIKSLNSQTVHPDETIIVDGGSKDRTLKILHDSKNKFPKLHLKILQKKGNRSVGRNFAIKSSKSEIIAVSDSGCVLNKDWFYEITKPFKGKQIDVVAGFYTPITHSIFEKSLSVYTCVMPENVTDGFLPSSRSIAFRKKGWVKVKGYPEELSTCEDLVFARNMKRKGLKFKVNKKAIVLWPQRKNIVEAFKQFFDYAKGDGEALYIRRQTPVLYMRVIVSIALVLNYLYSRTNGILFSFGLLLFLYVLWAIMKNYRYVGNSRALCYLPLLQVVSDFAVFFGMTIGIILRISR